MKSRHKLTLRLVSWASLISVASQMVMPVITWAQVPTLGTVDILKIEQQGTSDAVISFQPLPEGLTITARVDPDGNGDFLTLKSALAQIKTGVIAVSEGRLNEHDLVIPKGVIVRGGYDSRTWTAQTGKTTTVFGLPGKTSIVLNSGSGLQNIVIEQAQTAVRIASGAATLSKVVILQAKTAVELSPFSIVRIAHSDFVQNEKVIVGENSSRAFIFQSIFQENQSLINQNLRDGSFVKDSVFFPNKNSLANLQDENNQIRPDKPLPQGGWQFPDEEGGKVFDQTFILGGIVDDHIQSLPGPDISDPEGINAILVYYQLPFGDVLKVVDRDNFSDVVFQTPYEGGNFRGWIPVPLSKQLSLLLMTNGDGSIPLQVGVSRIAKISESRYETNPSNLTQGLLGDSAESNIFYRDLSPQALIHTLNQSEKDRIADIDKPLVINGQDWSTLGQATFETLEEVSNQKGFISRILLRGEGNDLAVRNYQEEAQEQNDPRYLSLLSDYLAFDQPFKLTNQFCEEETTCPWTATGLRTFLPLLNLSLKESTDSITNENGLFNTDGWTAPATPTPKLIIDTKQDLTQADFIWTEQILSTNPTSTSHVATLFGNNSETEQKNIIAFSINPDGNLKTMTWDKNGIRKITDSIGVSWDSTRKYKMILTINNDIATLSRDGIAIWSDRIQLDNLQKIQAGKSPIIATQNHLPHTMSDLSIWQKESTSKIFAANEGTTLRGTLGPDDMTLSGSFQFQNTDFCRENSLILKNGDTTFATFSGIAEGDTCQLILSSPLADDAGSVVSINDLQKKLQVVWYFNSVSGLGTISLFNEKKQILSTIPSFNSQPFKNPLIVNDLNIQSAVSLKSPEIHYYLLPQTSTSNLTSLLPVSRYEVIYDTNEAGVIASQGGGMPVTIEDLRKTPTPQKTVTGLEPGRRYFFAVKAILEDGTSSETTNIRNIQIQSTGQVASLEAGSAGRASISGTLALGNIRDLTQVFAQTPSNLSTVSSSSVLRGRLGDPLTLSSANSSGGASFVAWSLGRDLPASTNASPEHIYTQPGEYIVSELRKLQDGTILKQFGLVAVGHQPSDSPRITAETWTANDTNPNQAWVNKASGKKIPAIIGVNEPIQLLGNAVDVSGSPDNAYTWNYSVNWGDGTKDENEAVKNAFNKTRLISGEKEEAPINHSYSSPGIYTIVSQVKDEQNNTGVFENTVIVTTPEGYPQKILGLNGMGRILSLSGGTPPYSVTLLDGSVQNLPREVTSLPVNIDRAGEIVIRDSAGNTTSVPVEITDNPALTTKEIYLPQERKLEITPSSIKTKETVRVNAKGEEHLFRNTEAVAYYFGDVLPEYLGVVLPALDSPLTYSTSTEIDTEPFLSMGTYPAIITVIEGQGTEKKKAFSIQIQEARFTAQSNAGIVTGTLAPSFNTLPESLEIWDRGVENVRLAGITPNQSGHFIYIVPGGEKKSGLLTLRLQDKSGAFSTFAKNIHYNIESRPEVINGLLEINTGSPIFSNGLTPATNSKKPTFFGVNKEKDLQVTVASENPKTYPVKTNESGSWIMESDQSLADGKHTFTLSSKDGQQLSKNEFLVDTQAPKAPIITNASWTKIQGKTEPYGFVGIQGTGKDISEQYIQADASGNFVASFNQFNREYFLAAADQAGNVSTIAHILEKEWQEQTGVSTWQLIRPYLTWALLVAIAASGIAYARRVKV